jgi:hypothetical protein
MSQRGHFYWSLSSGKNNILAEKKNHFFPLWHIIHHYGRLFMQSHGLRPLLHGNFSLFWA